MKDNNSIDICKNDAPFVNFSDMFQRYTIIIRITNLEQLLNYFYHTAQEQQVCYILKVLLNNYGVMWNDLQAESQVCVFHLIPIVVIKQNKLVAKTVEFFFITCLPLQDIRKLF